MKPLMMLALHIKVKSFTSNAFLIKDMNIGFVSFFLAKINMVEETSKS